MTWTVILALGSGNLKNGFTHITAELKHRGVTIAKFPGSLPPALDVEDLQRRWKFSCTGLQSSRGNSRIKIKPSSKTYISETNPHAVYQGLKEEIQAWLKNDEFYSKIEVNLRTQIGNTSEYIQIFLECDDSQIWELPWDAWNFREEYRNCEIIRSPSEYIIVPQQATKPGSYLPSQGRILCVLGNTKGINVKKDAEIIRKSLGDSCELKFLEQPTPDEFNDRLFDEQGWQILFFAGHGDSGANARSGRLYINQNAANNTITVDNLKAGIKQCSFKGLQLLIFNSCSSLGLAADLVAQNRPLPSIIVMRAPIPDEIAHDFVKFLFGYLALGEPLFWAVRQAKDDLRRWDARFPGASEIPVLCQHPTFQELTLPKCGEMRPVIPVESVAGDRPKHPQFTISNKLMQRASISLAALAIGYPFVGPNLASAIDDFGKANHYSNPLIAKTSYKLAALINPTNGESSYNLSLLCDRLNEDECAREAMKQAVWRGLPEAYAQISRSLIIKNKPESALKVIGMCLEQTQFDGVKSACFKNRGWLRLNQKRYGAAETDLRKAISLSNKTPEAQCLLAQVLEAKGKRKEALTHWQQTLKSANSSIPEQDECIEKAKERLLITGKSK
ncbi:CHAT domain-containing protein [Microcoleus sp. herbarium7]|uniref:CHAT domain-containing tetratricopeptide repeat protein n=1 Tax=Microcoleus sp. herbarium7 TaxID=3055435 RepID=UPI002FD3BE5C